MAANILTNQLGGTYQNANTGNNSSLNTMYQLTRAEWIEIRTGAPAWHQGPSASPIPQALIETQRTKFIRMNGIDGLHLNKHQRN